jgi:hypothetical protein
VKLFRTVADLPAPLWDDVAARAPEVVVRSSGARLAPGGGFITPFMGGDYQVNPEARSIVAPAGRPEADFQTGLVLLTYLAKAQDLGLAGRLVPGRELNGGEMFFKGPHAFAVEPIIKNFGRAPREFVARAVQLGASAVDEGSGYAFRWLVLPHVEVGCVLYPEDDEFPAAVTYLFDAYTHHHLPLDAVWSLINIVSKLFG